MGMKDDDRRLAVVEAGRTCGRDFWESPSLGRVWKDVFRGGERGRVHVFEMLVCTVNEAAGLGAQGCHAQLSRLCTAQQRLKSEWYP